MLKTIVIYKLPNFSRQELEALFELAELKETRAENYAVNPPTEENTKN